MKPAVARDRAAFLRLRARRSCFGRHPASVQQAQHRQRGQCYRSLSYGRCSDRLDRKECAQNRFQPSRRQHYIGHCRPLPSRKPLGDDRGGKRLHDEHRGSGQSADQGQHSHHHRRPGRRAENPGRGGIVRPPSVDHYRHSENPASNRKYAQVRVLTEQIGRNRCADAARNPYPSTAGSDDYEICGLDGTV